MQCLCYSFCAVPFSLFVFGTEIYYSTCPWIYDYYRIDILRHEYQSTKPYIDIRCGITGWMLAGVCLLILIKFIVKKSNLNLKNKIANFILKKNKLLKNLKNVSLLLVFSKNDNF